MTAIGLIIDEQFEDGARTRAARTVGALLLDRLDGPERHTVAETLAFPTPGAERQARSRARRRARSLPALVDVVDRVIDLAA